MADPALPPSKRRAGNGMLQQQGVASPPQQVAPVYAQYPSSPPQQDVVQRPATPRKRSAGGGFEPPPPISKLDVKRTIVPPGQGIEPTYWSTNRWGAPAVPNRSLGPNMVANAALGGVPQLKRHKKHYQRHGSAQIKSPDNVVYSTLNDLETLMRAALGALASFNEDERMILTRQFRREEQRAQALGEYSPPGLVNVSQFRHAFKKFSVRVSEEQAHALFIKYGHDSQGLLPYDMFAAKLLTSPARMLALEPEQKGPYKPGMDGAFRGKIRYEYCHKPVFPPTNWDGTLAVRSAQKPKAGLQLEFVYGYAGKLNTANNLFWTADGKIVYYVAATGIVYDPETHTQQFFHGHNDDIKCIAIHPNRHIVATGQVASSLDGTYEDPFLCVWDTRDVLGIITRITFPSEGGVSSRYIVAMAFSGDGKRLVVVTGDNKHMTYVYHWRSKHLIYCNIGHNGQPPQVYGVTWNNFQRYHSKDGEVVVRPGMFVTYGLKHLKIWTLDQDRNGKEVYTSKMGRFGAAQVGDVLSACFVGPESLVTGTRGGDLLLWDLGGRRAGSFGSVLQVFPAHAPGPKAPSIHDGQMCLQGVRALCLRANNTELVSGGSDGSLIVWDITNGSLGRLLKTIPLCELSESSACSFRSLDALHDGYTLIVGTHRCEIWAVDNDIPESLIQGHTSDVFACAWHPKKPYKFATACDSSNVFLWNARRRQLIAKVNVGLAARSVTFSPNGAHLAVGTITGSIRVVQVDDMSQKVAEMHFSSQGIKELKYSPDGTKLASGSHDCGIDIFDVTRGYARLAHCAGHSSYINHIDWSVDSRIIQTTSGSYELLYFDPSNGKQVRQNQRDTLWHTWTLTLGFPVMGIWRPDNDGTDINSVCRTYRNPAWETLDPLAASGEEYVLTAGDDGRVRIFNYPCVVDNAPCRSYIAHCSHVTDVRVAPTNRWAISVGGSDRAAMQWRIMPEAQDEVIELKPQIEPYKVYTAPKRKGVVEDPLALLPDPAAAAAEAAAQITADAEAAAANGQKARDEAEALRRRTLKKYEVTTVTSNIKGASTDAEVYVVITGSKGKSGYMRLENSPDNFERGKTDVFMLECQDLGDVHTVLVGHNGKGSKPRWHLEKLIVLNKTDGGVNPAVFTCGQWMGHDVGNGQLSCLLKLGAMAPLTSRKYKVVVKTSDVKGAGTDANVFLTLFGEYNGNITKTKPTKLENSTNNFERGQTDIFEIEGAIGTLRHIYIGHDNTGVGADWHLQEVIISSPGTPDKQFVANRWLSTKEGDGSTYCTLYATGAADVEGPHKYKITVFTSDIRGAGTDARVYITFFNPQGIASRKFNLESSANNFERGMVDIFFITYPDLGGISEIEIEHDNSGMSPGWHCEQVVVSDETAQVRTAFPCDRWLARDEDDGMIRRRLKARAPDSDITSYRVTVMTSDLRGAGTDANVHISLCGERNGKEVWGPTHKLDTSKNNFERGQIDTFLLKKQKSLGEIKKVKIGHDNHGVGPGWHLDHVDIFDDATGKRYFFPCQKWFDKDEEDGLIERVLEAADLDADADTAMYKITVHTSDIKFAGTDANVFIQIFGQKDGQPVATPKLQLDNSKNNFERGMIDVFTLTTRNVKDIQRIVIGHDNCHAGADWHLKLVEVFNVMTSEKCSFFYNGWLALNEPPYKLEVELFPTGEEAPPVCRYGLQVYTSDIRGAGTDANVFCVLHGEKGQTPRVQLETSKNNFERGKRDDFVIESIDLGPITKLEIGHDDSGPGSGWHLSHVIVHDQASQEQYFFNADRWLEKSAGTLTVTLLPSSAEGAHQIYQVRVRTGDVRGAGTDADISIILMGSKGRSDEIQLESSADNFERNKLDEFKLDLGSQDLGEIQKVDIGFSTKQSVAGKLGGLSGKQWNLTSVEVLHFNTQSSTYFFEDDWLSDKRRRVLLQPGKVGENNVYRVVVRTSDIKGAGTDSNVTLSIVGEKDGQVIHTGPQKLDSSANDFERGHVDTFVLKCKDVGELKRVLVTSDGSGLGPSWHLNQVEVTDTVRGVTQYFPCNQWLDPSDPMSLNKVLLPRNEDGTIGELLQYEVVMYTSDTRGAGTDANVEIEMWGTKDHTSPQRLDTSANNFERGQKDIFALQAPDIGDLTHVIVRKDDSGVASDWHLQSVEVLHPATKKRFFMVCNDWFKGASEKKLEVGKLPEGGKCLYRVTVHTSDTRGAGTDANVKMRLYGEKGDTGERKLDSSANDFERGRVDTFFIEAIDVGFMHRLTIGHDNSGLGPGWHLAKVEVVNMVTGERAVFPHHDWIDKEHGLSVDLTPDRTGDGKGDGYFGTPLTDHTITVYTSDIRGAGTDANVFIELYGSEGSIGQTRLDNKANNFERNMKDEFKIKGSHLGDVQRVVIRHDNAGISPDWHLRQVEVFSEDTQKTFVFPCNDWLKKEGADESGLRKELVAGSPDQKGPTNYCITVYTSDIRGAGTDADVSVVVYGEHGDTGERTLDNSRQNNFERGKVDTFFVTAPNMGPMKALKVKSDNSGLGGAWHLAKIEVSSSATGERLVFPFHNWVSKNNGLEHLLWPDRDGDGEGDVGDLGLVKYRVSTYTSDERGAGTDANVTIALHGKDGFVGATPLENAQNNFERGRKDEFEISGTDVGELTHVVVAHDNSSLGSAWKLDQVEVFHPKLKRLFQFPCHDWLQVTDAEGLDGCKKTLQEGSIAAAEKGTATYRVLVQTSDTRGAGTDSDIFIRLFGPQGDSGERLLDTSANNFERGKLDTFMFTGPDVGEIQRIKVRSSNTGLGASWHLSHIDVVSSSLPGMFHFPFNNWVDSKNGLEHFIWRDGTVDPDAKPIVDYRVTVFTSDIRGAGTDANVFIEMYGSEGAVGKTRLENSADNFERNHADLFVIRGTEIGDIERVVISHDNSGAGPAWHCQEVDIFNPSTQRTYTFPCNEWLEKTKELGMDGCRKELVFGKQEGEDKCEYRVEVKTGDVRGAGTDANVEVGIFGTKGDTGMQPIADSRNNFERGKTDVFFITAPDIGMLTDLRVVCDGAGMAADWFLDYIVVTNATLGTRAKFPFHNWFDSKNGWAHTLTPEGMETDTTNIVKYQVTVFTSDIRGAGTDGDVYLALKGERGVMGESRLESGRGNFERNSVDVFEIVGSAIGPLKEATVRLVPKGAGPDWHFKQIEVLNLKTGAKAVFVYDDWLEGGKAGEAGASVTLLEASSAEARAERTSDQWRITTVTGTQSGAGTDADVFVQIWGPNGMLGNSEIYLDDSKDNFEKGAIDNFVREFPIEKDCGSPIERLVVERGKTFMCGANWNLDMIEVYDMSRGHTYKWACGKWFNDTDGLVKEWRRDRMGKKPQDLELIEAPAGTDPTGGAPQTKGNMYRLEFKTSDKLGAGTDASVRVELADTAGRKWRPRFKQESAMFERGSKDVFMSSAMEPLEELDTARVYLENSQLGDGWHLDSLHVTQLPSQRKWLFRHNGWVPKEGVTLKAEVVNDVPLKGDPLADYRADVQQMQDQGGQQRPPRPVPKAIDYEVVVHTGNKLGAGTDATVTAEIVGSLFTAQHTFDQERKLFDRKSVDKFRLHLPDCGDLKSVRLWHDGSGVGKAEECCNPRACKNLQEETWLVHKVSVEALPYKSRYEAKFDQWVKSGKGKAAEAPLNLVQGSKHPSQTPEGAANAAAVQQEREEYEQGLTRKEGIDDEVLDEEGWKSLPQFQASRPEGPQPGDPGIDPDVLDADDWKDLMMSQQQGARRKDHRDQDRPRVKESSTKQQRLQQQQQQQEADTEPTCDWVQYTGPYAEDPDYDVTWYHNAKTGESSWDKPPEYAEWEKQHERWRARQQSRRS